MEWQGQQHSVSKDTNSTVEESKEIDHKKRPGLSIDTSPMAASSYPSPCHDETTNFQNRFFCPPTIWTHPTYPCDDWPYLFLEISPEVGELSRLFFSFLLMIHSWLGVLLPFCTQHIRNVSTKYVVSYVMPTVRTQANIIHSLSKTSVVLWLRQMNRGRPRQSILF